MAKIDAFYRYVDGVSVGDIVACKWVRLAVERHQRDVKTGKRRGLYFDQAAVERILRFFTHLKHSKGEWAGQVFEPEPWEVFILGSLFGWKRKVDDTRRFRTGYIEVARKNGKSTLLAGTGLYLFFGDTEPGAEVYTAATKKDQAKITHSESTRMVKASPELKRYINIYRDNLHIEETNAKYEPLGANEDTMDGLNVHGAIVDEVHAHKNRSLWDVLETATGARRQPLMLGITTAGVDRLSLCYELHEYVEKVLEKILRDDSFFGIIYSLDKGDSWKDETNWGKSNPNLGVSVKMDDLRRKAKRAAEMPSALNAFLRLHLNVWTESEVRWIDADRWNACSFPVDPEGLFGRQCYGGLDLSSTGDLTAWVLVFPPETDDDPYQVLCRFFVPQENIIERVRKDRVPYDVWVRQGYITATPGNVIDYDYILAQIDDDAQKYDLKEIAFDRYGATKIIQDLSNAGLTVVQFGQGFISMSPPTKELERLILLNKIAHGGNPVLSWNASNVMVRIDPAGLIKPDKSKSREKIDGIVSLIMGLDRATRHGQGGTGPSIYEEREPLSF